MAKMTGFPNGSLAFMYDITTYRIHKKTMRSPYCKSEALRVSHYSTQTPYCKSDLRTVNMRLFESHITVRRLQTINMRVSH